MITKSKQIPYKVTVIFSWLFCISLQAQDYKVDFKKACDIYTHNNYEVELGYLFYPSLTASVPIEKDTVWMRKMGSNYHLKQPDTEMIANKKYIVIINKYAQTVGIDKIREPIQEAQEDKETRQLLLNAFTETLISLGVDTTQKDVKDPFICKYLGINSGSKVYQFDYNYGEYSRVISYISSKTGLLQKMTCFYREPVEIENGVFEKIKVEIIFLKQISGEKFTDSMFSLDHILSVDKKGEVVLKNKYTQYQLINNIYRQEPD